MSNVMKKEKKQAEQSHSSAHAEHLGRAQPQFVPPSWSFVFEYANA